MEKNPILFAVVKATTPTGQKLFSKWHDTLESAQTEAARLAGKTGEAFYVIQTVGVMRPTQPPVEWEKCEQTWSANSSAGSQF